MQRNTCVALSPGNPMSLSPWTRFARFSTIFWMFVFSLCHCYLVTVAYRESSPEQTCDKAGVDPSACEWTPKATFSKEELRKRLDPQQFDVTQNQGTERAFTGHYYDHKEVGTYRCIVCNNKLFSSKEKFDSGSGWPSFYDFVQSGAVHLRKDSTHGMERTEVICDKCGAHLGHVFDDGPRPTGKRYCINSASLQFDKKQ